MQFILTTWVKYKSLDDLRLVLVPPKIADLELFHGIDHVDEFCFEDKEMKKPCALLWAEMYRCRDLLLEHGVTHISRLPFTTDYRRNCLSIIKRETDLVEKIQQPGVA